MNNQNVKKINKYQNKSKYAKESKDDMLKELEPELKKLNQYFKLEKLKQQEKLFKFQEGFIDTTSKPDYFFMRSELKSNKKEFIPSTNISSTKRKKTFSTLYKKGISLNGFRNYSGKKMETEIIKPHNFDGINLLIEEKEGKNDIMIKRYLMKKELNKKKRKSKNAISRNLEKNKIKLENNNDGFTKSFIINKTEANIKILDDKKIKRPNTSKVLRYTPQLINNKIINEYKIKYNNNNNNRNHRIIKSATNERPKNPKTQRESKNNNNNEHLRSQYSNLNRSYKNTSSYTTTFKSYSKSGRKNSKRSKIFKNIEKQTLISDSLYITNIIKTPLPTERNEFKSAEQIIKRVLNDCNIIDQYIRHKEGGVEHSFRTKKKDEILLKLSDRLKINRLKRLKSSKKDKKSRILLEDEKVFEEKLAKIPKVAKKFFRDIYKQILFEKRVLNKNDVKNAMVSIEEKQEKKKLDDAIKKEVQQRMVLTKENFVTEKDDKKFMNEQRKVFGFYRTLDGLEWLITKKHVLKLGAGHLNRRNIYK